MVDTQTATSGADTPRHDTATTAKDTLPPPLRGIIFDLDGTLADTLPVCFAAFRAAFARYAPARTFTDTQIAAYFGPSEEGILRQVVPPEHQAAALATYLAAYDAAHDQRPAPFPGITTVLDLLRTRGIPVAVVTGKGAASAALSLRHLGLADRFPVVEAGSSEGNIKPQSIRNVLQAWNLAPGDTAAIAYLGDAPSDVGVARATGLVPLAAAWAPTADPDALATSLPAQLFRSVTEFALWVEERTRPALPATISLPDWLGWARQMQALAQNGLTYAQDPFDIQRYQSLRDLAVHIVATYTHQAPADLQALFAGGTGYATPKLDVRGAVFRTGANDTPEILLVKERSDGGWTLPGGWVDVGQSPSHAVEKEVREEAGLAVRATKILAVLDRDRHGHPPLAVHVWKVFLLCQTAPGTAAPTMGDGLETDAVAFFPENALPPLSRTRIVPSQIARLFEHHRRPDLPTDFD